MSTTTTHDHPPQLAHHFDDMEQQYASGKLGMWVFLATEILMFGGLFCAYGVYRYNHPEVFVYAHHYLSIPLGGINTLVLITSSLTMAWAVRAAQLGQQKLLRTLLILTILGGFGFMFIKTIEYSSKWKHHLWVGGKSNMYSPQYKGPEAMMKPEAPKAANPKPPAAPAVVDAPVDPNAGSGDAANIRPRTAPPAGLAHKVVEEHRHKTERERKEEYEGFPKLEKQRVYTFFGVYFVMTGLHGIHVLVGMGLIFWIYLRARKNQFSPAYFAPVDLVGLYWHLVDLIWIFLFPLLYLIH